MQGGAESLLGAGALGVRPEEGQQMVAGERARMGSQIIEQGATLAPGQVQRLTIEQNFWGTEKLDGEQVVEYSTMPGGSEVGAFSKSAFECHCEEPRRGDDAIALK